MTLAAAVPFFDPSVARADEPTAPSATFALIIGSNASVDTDVAPLHYADDDAARYQDLFRLLGAHSYLLTRLDDNTRRLHPQAAAEAQEPRRAQLEQAVAQLVADVTQARARGVETVAYVVYAGHGNVKNGQGYITLEDARITGADLARVVAKIPATSVHVIADACASYFLAYGRGPGGERRPLHGFQDVPELAALPNVGLLLSTSSARESHEWDGFEGGVFSREVRSGLYGAADADGDGRVSYREIAAFVSRASEAIPAERFRPDVHARAPKSTDTLADIRRALGRRLDVDGAHAGHYYVEDGAGVRIADFHNAPGQIVHLVRPPPTGPVYLRRVDDDREFTLPSSPEIVALADLSDNAPRSQSRGAAHDAFARLFSIGFDEHAVDTYVERPAPPAPPADAVDDEEDRRAAASAARRRVGWLSAGLGAAGLAAGGALAIAAVSTSNGSSAAESQADASRRNNRVTTLNEASIVAYGVGGAALLAGAVLLLLPDAKHVRVSAAHGGGSVRWAGEF